ncbi:MAG: tetratricopeptide repeat protein [Deltaproteobacteria bacterium]|nr:MAG: tetratricopeptide repeat protein [Deltaproteobacteria bacterium]
MSQHPSRIGPFRIDRILGRGGTGVVYAAVRESDDQRVALKLIHADRSHHRLITREVASLSRLRHPQIVAVVDHGEEDGAPWFAMQLVEGEHLSEMADRRFGSRDRSSTASMLTFMPGDDLGDESWPEEPLGLVEVAGGRLVEALTLVRALCEPLAFLHGEGLVHRDLKPENVLIRADGLPVLVDFGLASGFAARGREALDLHALRAGTPPYMAPEQVRGSGVDARADLYALGCILYELLTGRPPFVGLRAAVLRAHVHEEPRPPSAYVAGVPPGLDALCLGLLAKVPSERIAYATEVATRLEALGAQPPQTRGPSPRAYLYRPRLVGRREALRDVERQIDEGGLCLVVGEEGSGKTRLVEAVARRWGRRGGQVVVGAGRGVGEASALGAFRPALRALAARTELFDDLGPHREVLARFEPGFGEPGTEALSPEAEHLRLVRAMSRALGLLADEGRILLVIDDVHRADALSLDVLAWAARVGLSLPVVATVRPRLLPQVLRDLASERPVVALSRLTPEQVAEVAADMLAQQPSTELIAWLVGLTDGNPFAIAEALRLALAEGVIAGDEALDGMPATVDELVERRLTGVSARSRTVLDAASVLGPDLGAEVLGAMLGLSVHEAIAEAGPLLAAEVFELQPNGALAWVHDPLWVAGRARLGADERRTLHLAAASALEAQGEEAWLPAIGWHLHASGRPQEAALAYERAAVRALGQGALAEAERRYREAAELAMGADGRRIRLHLASRVLAARGANDEAQQLLVPLLTEAQEARDRQTEGEVWDALSRIHSHASNPEEQLHAAREAQACWVEIGDAHRIAGAVHALGIALGDSGDRPGAKGAYLEALAAYRELGDERGQAEALSNLALHALGDGELALAEEIYVEAQVLAERTGHRIQLGRIVTNLATVAWRRGDLDTAVALLERALGLHRALGARRSEGITLSNLAVGRVEQGRLAEARSLFDEALAIDREVLNRRSEAWDLAELGELHVALGDVDAARRDLWQGVEVARSVPEPYVLAHVLLAWVRFARQADGLAGSPEFAELEQAVAAAGRHGQGARVLGERGHQKLAQGLSAQAELDALRALLEGREGDTEAVEALQRLEDAVSLGRGAHHGDAPKWMPEVLRPRAKEG